MPLEKIRKCVELQTCNTIAHRLRPNKDFDCVNMISGRIAFLPQDSTVMITTNHSRITGKLLRSQIVECQIAKGGDAADSGSWAFSYCVGETANCGS